MSAAFPQHWEKATIRRIVAAVSPERIILFGSRTRGDARPDSDLDLLVVLEIEEPPGWRSLSICRALRDISASKDSVVYTPLEPSDWEGVSASLISRAIREGVELYQRQAA